MGAFLEDMVVVVSFFGVLFFDELVCDDTAAMERILLDMMLYNGVNDCFCVCCYYKVGGC
jgi:hypothetical protein